MGENSKAVPDQFVKGKVGPWGLSESQQLSSFSVIPLEWSKNVLNKKPGLETSKELVISSSSPSTFKAYSCVQAQTGKTFYRQVNM